MASEHKWKYASRLFDDACSKIGVAAVKQPKAEYYAGWGFALSGKAMSERFCHGGRTDESETCWEQASEKLEIAMALDPCSIYAAAMRGRCLSLRAFFEKGSVRQSLLSQAKENCLLAESLSRGSAAVWLANMAAFLREESECKKWLVIAEESGQLPKKSSPHVLLAGTRFGNKAWYKGLAWKPE